jgi:hypothetical protein
MISSCAALRSWEAVRVVQGRTCQAASAVCSAAHRSLQRWRRRGSTWFQEPQSRRQGSRRRTGVICSMPSRAHRFGLRLQRRAARLPSSDADAPAMCRALHLCTRIETRVQPRCPVFRASGDHQQITIARRPGPPFDAARPVGTGCVGLRWLLGRGTGDDDAQQTRMWPLPLARTTTRRLGRPRARRRSAHPAPALRGGQQCRASRWRRCRRRP